MATVERRVTDDLKAGRLWKARDRLLGVIRTDPANQWALNLLGEIYFRMADLPAAGRTWFLTSRSGTEWEAAEAALYERYGRRAIGLIAEIPVRAPIDTFPEVVQMRLKALQQEVAHTGKKWEPRAGQRVRPQTRTSFRGIASGIAFIVLLILAFIGLVNGIVTVASALGNALGIRG